MGEIVHGVTASKLPAKKVKRRKQPVACVVGEEILAYYIRTVHPSLSRWLFVKLIDDKQGMHYCLWPKLYKDFDIANYSIATRRLCHRVLKGRLKALRDEGYYHPIMKQFRLAYKVSSHYSFKK